MDYLQIHTALQSADEEERRACLKEMRTMSLSSAEEFCFIAMGDENWRIRKEAVDCYVSYNPDSSQVIRLLQLIRNEANAGLRSSAAEAIIRLGMVSVKPLIDIAYDTDVDVRKIVVDAMGSIGSPLFIPVLINLLHDRDVNVASAASEQLGKVGKESLANGAAIATCLIDVLLEREDELFRFSILQSLTLMARPIAVPRGLIRLAEQPILTKAVYDCLGAIGDESCLNLLMTGLRFNSRSCRIAALKAICHIYGRVAQSVQAYIASTMKYSMELTIAAGLLKLHDMDDTELTTSLLWIGGITRDVRCIPLLLEAYGDERFSDTAFTVLTSVGREAVQDLVDSCSSDESRRVILCELIAECGFVEYITVIGSCLHDVSPQVRRAAAYAAALIGAHSLIAELVDLLDDSEQQVYGAVVATLCSFAPLSRSTIQAHTAVLCSSPLSHRRKAAVQLSAALHEKEHLLLLLKDEDPHVRRAAVCAIGGMKIADFYYILLLVLTDEDPDVRIAAAEAVGNLQRPSSLDALEQALSDDDVWVQSAVLNAIAAIDPVRVAAIINRIHTNAEGLLMITCLSILEKLPEPVSDSVLRHAAQSSDPDIARQATELLEKRLSITPQHTVNVC